MSGMADGGIAQEHQVQCAMRSRKGSGNGSGLTGAGLLAASALLDWLTACVMCYNSQAPVTAGTLAV